MFVPNHHIHIWAIIFARDTKLKKTFRRPQSDILEFMPTETQPHIDLKSIASDVLTRSLKAGASDAEVVLYEGDEFSALVRLGQVDTLKESGSRAIGLRVFIGQHVASTSSSDLSPEGLTRLVEGAIALARITSEDPFAGLPEPAAFGKLEGDLHLYFDDVNHMPPAERIEIARRTEAAALAYDIRIQNSRGGDFDTATSHKIMLNSRGFFGEYRRSYCGFSASPIAQDEKGNMQRDHWFSNARTTTKLDNPEAVGHEAARRALRRLNARRVPTQKASVVFAPELSQSVFDNIGGFGTRPFDGEGLPTRRTILVERGILKNYVLNTYTARKLHMQSTGNASRGLAGNPGIGAGNFFLAPGTLSPEQIIADVKTGLYVTETMGHGVNLVTGDYSHGASGLWIENGEIAFPVEEITIAGNLKDMYKNIVAIGNDLVFHGASAAPTLRIEGMTIAGS